MPSGQWAHCGCCGLPATVCEPSCLALCVVIASEGTSRDECAIWSDLTGRHHATPHTKCRLIERVDGIALGGRAMELEVDATVGALEGDLRGHTVPGAVSGDWGLEAAGRRGLCDPIKGGPHERDSPLADCEATRHARQSPVAAPMRSPSRRDVHASMRSRGQRPRSSTASAS